VTIYTIGGLTSLLTVLQTLGLLDPVLEILGFKPLNLPSVRGGVRRHARLR
jgi:hypothetical protein